MRFLPSRFPEFGQCCAGRPQVPDFLKIPPRTTFKSCGLVCRHLSCIVTMRLDRLPPRNRLAGRQEPFTQTTAQWTSWAVSVLFVAWNDQPEFVG